MEVGFLKSVHSLNRLNILQQRKRVMGISLFVSYETFYILDPTVEYMIRVGYL